MKCKICPRNCEVDRGMDTGYCLSPDNIKISRADLHMWEEPCISGDEGSGTIFFSGCNLRCIYCQNHKISRGNSGKEITVRRLAELMLELEARKANNINLVTPTHYVPKIIEAIDIAKSSGLSIPIVYNTSSYEKVSTLQSLEGYVDIYLPDFKYYDNEIAARYSNAYNYREIASLAIDEMVRQCGEAEFEESGMIRKGVIVRHLVLPSHTLDSKKVIEHLYGRYGDKIYISIMNQYTPICDLKEYPKLNRKLTQREYDSVVDFAINLGVENGFIQEGDTAKESFIPDFEFKG